MVWCRLVASIIAVITNGALARSQTLDLQAMCATQARKAFQEWEKDQNEPKYKSSFPLVSADYQSHYNTKIKKCLVLIEANHSATKNEQISTSVLLTDAFERRVYANYLWISRPNKMYWEVPPMTCELLPSLRDQKQCKTREEFDAFVADYMEE